MISTIAVFTCEFQAVFTLNFDIFTESVIICLSLLIKYFYQRKVFAGAVLFETKILLIKWKAG